MNPLLVILAALASAAGDSVLVETQCRGPICGVAQIAVPMVWQAPCWRLINGRRVFIAGHYHKALGRCPICWAEASAPVSSQPQGGLNPTVPVFEAPSVYQQTEPISEPPADQQEPNSDEKTAKALADNAKALGDHTKAVAGLAEAIHQLGQSGQRASEHIDGQFAKLSQQIGQAAEAPRSSSLAIEGVAKRVAMVDGVVQNVLAVAESIAGGATPAAAAASSRLEQRIKQVTLTACGASAAPWLALAALAGLKRLFRPKSRPADLEANCSGPSPAPPSSIGPTPGRGDRDDSELALVQAQLEDCRAQLQGKASAAAREAKRLKAELDKARQELLEARKADSSSQLALKQRVAELEAEIQMAKETENQYVRVPAVDPVGESYKEACRRYAQANPSKTGLVKTIEELAKQILHGKKVKAKSAVGWDDQQELGSVFSN